MTGASVPPPTASTSNSAMTTISSPQAVMTTVFGDLLTAASRSGTNTSEFWVTVLSPIISGLVGFAVAFLVAHHLLASDQAAAISGAVTSAAVAFAAAHAAQAYSAARAAVKAGVMEILRMHLVTPPKA